MRSFEIEPRGPFSLRAAREFADGFPAGIGAGSTSGTSLAMAFPLEPAASGDDGWRHSAVAELTQVEADGPVLIRLETDGDEHLALAQALRCVSLDVDGAGWPEVGRRDAVIGRLQREHAFLRPVCFYSAYEAATSFVIGQRISRHQGARIKARLSELVGDELELDGVRVRAFPRPERLVELDEVPGLAPEKVRRLRGLAVAALDGRLATERLRTLPVAEALSELRGLRGVGEFTAQGVLLRGCALVDEIPDDDLSREVVGDMYAAELAAGVTVDAIVERWRPFRMWATVLLRVGWGRRQGASVSYRRDRTTRKG